MTNKGFTLIESLLFFSLVLFIISYSCNLIQSLNHLENIQKNYDHYYEEAYK